MDLSLAISCAALFVSLVTFFLARNFALADSRKRLAIDMWKRWQDEPLRKHRVDSWTKLKNLNAEFKPGEIKISELGDGDIKSINEVEHFLEAISKFIDHNQIDKKLTKTLFGRNFEQWHRYSNSISRDEVEEELRNEVHLKSIYNALVKNRF